jgi:hypothetical protein
MLCIGSVISCTNDATDLDDCPQSVVTAADNGRARVVRSMSITSSIVSGRLGDQFIDDWTPSNSKIFQAILCFGFALIVVLFLISNEKVTFDMGKPRPYLTFDRS